MKRRELLASAAAGLLLSPLARANTAAKTHKVVVVGAGYGGATAAKYLAQWAPFVEVTLVEQGPKYYSCPMSNLVVAGSKNLSYIAINHQLAGYGVKMVTDSVQHIDADKRQVHLASGQSLRYDRLVLSPGIDYSYEDIEGWNDQAAALFPAAWKAGPETQLLSDQLQAMPKKGTVVIAIPRSPYRCPPGPYERVCLVADRLLREKQGGKVLVLDANDKIQSKEPLFKRLFETRYKDVVEYRVNAEVKGVDSKQRLIKTDVEDIKADVFNLIPPQRAGSLAKKAGLANANGRFCQVHFAHFESTAAAGIHVIGDAVQSAVQMPKSAHIANQQGKVVAAALAQLLQGKEVMADSVIHNTCYSMIGNDQAIRISTVFSYQADKKTYLPLGGGLSNMDNAALEGQYAYAWAQNIWRDSFA